MMMTPDHGMYPSPGSGVDAGMCMGESPSNLGPATDGWNYGQQENYYPDQHPLSLPALQGVQCPYPGTVVPHHQPWYCKRRENWDFGKFIPHASHPSSIARRNERERTRVKTINSTFAKLRNHLPSGAKNKKLSKVQILRNAITYINQLQQILDAQDAELEDEEERTHGQVKSEPEEDDVNRTVTSRTCTSSFLSSDSPVTSPVTSQDSPHSDAVDDDIEDKDDEGLGELSDWL